MTLQDILGAILPKATGGISNQDGIQSAGGSIQFPGMPQAGGTVGLDHGVPFANANVNHQPVMSMGPNDPGSGLVDNGGQSYQPSPIEGLLKALFGEGATQGVHAQGFIPNKTELFPTMQRAQYTGK